MFEVQVNYFTTSFIAFNIRRYTVYSTRTIYSIRTLYQARTSESERVDVQQNGEVAWIYNVCPGRGLYVLRMNLTDGWLAAAAVCMYVYLLA
jgi:hypothetical protein